MSALVAFVVICRHGMHLVMAATVTVRHRLSKR
jgi:hypothetical protein